MTPETRHISPGFCRESARWPSSSISLSFITNVFTANQCNGLECVVCEHLYVYINVYVLWAPGHDRTLIRAAVVILNYKTHSGTCQAPLYTARSNIFEFFYV